MTEPSRRQLASLPIALILLLACTAGSAQEARYNIYTVDKPMPSFGDIVSNYVAARHLARRTGVEVNLYIAREHHEKFGNVLPRFAEEMQEPLRVDVGLGRRLNIYRNNPPVEFGERTCNLAFTINKRQELALPKLYDFNSEQTPAPESDNRIFRALQATALQGEPQKTITPFLFFSILQPPMSAADRVDITATRDMMLNSAPAPGANARVNHWPAVFFQSGLLNKLVFLSETPPATKPITGGGIHHLGLAYTGDADLITEYIDDVMALAAAKPGRRFAVVVPRNYQLTHVNVAEPNFPWYVDGLDADNSQRHQLADNFAVFIVPNGLSYARTERYMAAANLPVLVTGTMSLSSALQFGKPFLYEVVLWHVNFAAELGTYIAGANAMANVLTTRAVILPKNHQVLPTLIGEAAGEHAETRAAATAARKRFLFGIGADGQADWDVFDSNYLAFQARLMAFRANATPTAPRRQLLDDIPRLCGEARVALRAINNDFSKAGQQLERLQKKLSE